MTLYYKVRRTVNVTNLLLRVSTRVYYSLNLQLNATPSMPTTHQISDRQIAFLLAERPADNATPIFSFSVPAISKLITLTVESLWTAPTETAKRHILAIDEAS